MRALLLTLTMFSVNAFAGWTTSIVKDEMYGTATEVTSTNVPPINGNGPDLNVSILKAMELDRKINILFRLTSPNKKIDCESSCEIAMRFDDFEVTKQRFIESKSGFISSEAPLSLVRGMSFADVIYIEFPLADGTTYQYKIEGNPLPKPIEPYPTIEIFNLKIGADKTTLPPTFTSAKAGGCFIATDVPVAEGYFKAEKVFVCLAKDKIASISFDVNDKKQRKVLQGYLTKQFGGSDQSLATYQMINWPNGNNSPISYNTVRATSLIQTHIITDALHDYFKRSDQ